LLPTQNRLQPQCVNLKENMVMTKVADPYRVSCGHPWKRQPNLSVSRKNSLLIIHTRPQLSVFELDRCFFSSQHLVCRRQRYMVI